MKPSKKTPIPEKPPASDRADAIARVRMTIRGAVQGVGFRPFVYRLAGQMELSGWIRNTGSGVVLEAEGPSVKLSEWVLRVEKEKPAHALIQGVETVFLDPAGYDDFEILQSEGGLEKDVLIQPDIATCQACLNDITDPENRRFGYAFTNCTHCGPRFSIQTSVPYDRANTSMKKFRMCPDCLKEYENPSDRRFHAQPNACPECGPRVEFWDYQGNPVKGAVTSQDALRAAENAICEGRIVAVKGLGGFHLVADARNEGTIQRLRERKRRDEKPFALMFPTLESVRKVCDVSSLEERILRSPEAPIVILKRKSLSGHRTYISQAVALRCPTFGVMLPYTPLHHLLMRRLGFPIVATSGNISDETLCRDENRAVHRLRGIAEFFLVHNRPIVHHADDSIVRVLLDREMVLRRARGFAPLPTGGTLGASDSVLGVGAHLKNTIGISRGGRLFLSQHIGDLESEETLRTFHSTVEDLKHLYDCKPTEVACDLHPDYLSSKEARKTGLPVTEVQHHYAHVLACMAENEVQPPVLGIAWDGTGYGTDKTVWGGEFLLVDETSFKRVASLRPFGLPGGEKAVREPRRSALGALYEIFGDELFLKKNEAPLEAFSPEEVRVFRGMLLKKTNTPMTTSAGRLFDAVASMMDLCHISRFEGQAAMKLEFLAGEGLPKGSYPFDLKDSGGRWIIDWEPMVQALLKDRKLKTRPDVMAGKFHQGLVEAIVAVAKRIGCPKIALTGGCFQNKKLTEWTVAGLRQEGFRSYWHQRVPPNDGGIALGQMAAVLRKKGLLCV